MKKIALVYRNRENMDAIYHLEEEIKRTKQLIMISRITTGTSRKNKNFMT